MKLGATRIGFRLTYADFDGYPTEEAIAGLVGKTASFNVLGEKVSDCRIVSAERYTDELMGEGVWIQADLV